MAPPSERLAHALEYLARGWTPLALCGPRCERHFGRACESPGKVPLASWKHWQSGNRRPSAWDIGRAWRDRPDANVGIVLGKASGLVAVDVDGNERGMSLLDSRSGGEVGAALVFSTARGIRLLYAFDARITNCELEGVGGARLEVLTTGRQTVAPPSVHPTGHVYAWMGEWRGKQPPPPPAWLVRLSNERGAKNGRFRPARGELVTEGRRNSTAFELACAVRRWGFTREEMLVVLGVLNERCVPPLEEKEMFEIADKVERRYQPWSGT